MAKPWKCRIGLHKWRTAWSEDGQKYRHCDRCGHDNDPGSGPRAAPGMGG
jgi:hypothetical protein